uniref:Uncharacterized protein n=1 Tax=Salarias fasciatus TaxID=181472 RepID=A0A672H7V3_SALFA
MSGAAPHPGTAGVGAPGKRERSGAVRGSPLFAPTPRPDRCPLVGQCGHAKGLLLCLRRLSRSPQYEHL